MDISNPVGANLVFAQFCRAGGKGRMADKNKGRMENKKGEGRGKRANTRFAPTGHVVISSL